jgi:hypothetical protein
LKGIIFLVFKPKVIFFDVEKWFELESREEVEQERFQMMNELLHNDV